MNIHLFTVGERVQIDKQGQFRGLKGTIQRVTARVDMDGERRSCWYLIALDMRREPIWFEHAEVSSLEASPFALQQDWH